MSMPPFDPDDQRLTAYALGEGSEADRQAVETFLNESAQARVEVEQTRAIARALTAEYAREHALYLASRPEEEVPSKVVAFRSEGRRSWRPAAVLMLKAAAVVALSASLVYLALRTPRRPELVTVANKPASAPAVATNDQESKDKPVGAKKMEESDARQASASDRERPLASATPPAGPTASSADSALAMDRVADADENPAPAASGRAAEAFPRTAAAAPPSARASDKAAPGSASAGTATVLPPAKPAAPEGRIARSMVRVHTAAGAFFGGVVVSADGLILATTSLPESTLKQPCTVLLADQRALPAAAKPAKIGSGWYWLRVNAKGLPATTPAMELPSNGAPVTLASIDPQTGDTAYSQVPAASAESARRGARARGETSPKFVGNATFAFNTEGELLLLEHGAREPQSIERAKTRSATPVPVEPTARPFTDAERALLKQEIENNAPGQ